jgi:hypothetical protein
MNRSLSFLLSTAIALAMVSSGLPASASPQYVLTLAASPASYTGKCPALIHLHGKIVVNYWNAGQGPTLTYSLLNSDGIDSFAMHGTVTNPPGAVIVTDARTPSASGLYWVKIHLHLGGPAADLYSAPARFAVKCIGSTEPTPNPNATPTKPPCITPAGVPCPTPHPNATPTPCAPTAATAIPCPPPGRRLPDLTSGKEIIVGGSVGGGALPSGVVGHHVAWGTVVALTDADAFLISNGRCAFNISYVLANIGPVNAAGPFKDVIRSDASTVSIQSALSQAALTHRSINTQAYLDRGIHTLSLMIDDGNAVVESNELNNYFTIKYRLGGKCGPGSSPLTN